MREVLIKEMSSSARAKSNERNAIVGTRVTLNWQRGCLILTLDIHFILALGHGVRRFAPIYLMKCACCQNVARK